MLHKLGYYCQCDTCGKALRWDDEVDEQGECEACATAYHAQQARYWRGLREGERRAGLLRPQSEINQDLRDAGRGHLIGDRS